MTRSYRSPAQQAALAALHDRTRQRVADRRHREGRSGCLSLDGAIGRADYRESAAMLRDACVDRRLL